MPADNPTAEEAKARVKGWMDGPEHKRPQGHPDDERTKDDDLHDPKHQKEDE